MYQVEVNIDVHMETTERGVYNCCEPLYMRCQTDKIIVSVSQESVCKKPGTSQYYVYGSGLHQE